MKPAFLLIVLVAATLTCISQPVTVQWGPPVESKSARAASAAIPGTNYTVDIKREGGAEFVFGNKGFDATTHVVRKTVGGKSELKEIGPPAGSKGISVMEVIALNSQMYVLLRRDDKKAKMIRLLAQKLDDDLNLVGEPVEVASALIGGDFKFETLLPRTYHNRLLVYNYNQMGVYGSIKQITYTLLDASLAQIWRAEFKVPQGQILKSEPGRQRLGLFTTVDSIGNFTTVVQTAAGEKKSNWLWGVSASAGEPIQVHLQGNARHVEGISVNRGTNSNTILVAYLYSNGKRASDGMEGIHLTQVSANTMTVTSEKDYPFKADLVAELVGEKKAAKGELPASLMPSSVYQKADGGMVAILEHEVSSTETSTSAMGQVSMNPKTYFGSVVILGLDEAKGIEWHKVISRSMSGCGNRSITQFRHKNAIHILFNTSGKNEWGIYADKLTRDCDLAVVSISDQGTVLGELISSPPDEHVMDGNIVPDGNGNFRIQASRINAMGKSVTTSTGTLQVK
jgi:hypothetical protein